MTFRQFKDASELMRRIEEDQGFLDMINADLNSDVFGNDVSFYLSIEASDMSDKIPLNKRTVDLLTSALMNDLEKIQKQFDNI